jgi:protein-disulfide isomerase
MPAKLPKVKIPAPANFPVLPKIKFNRSMYTPILIVLLILASFLIGILITKVQYLEKGVSQTTTAPTTGNTTAGDTAAPPTTTVDIEQIKSLFTDENITFGDSNRKNLFVEVADPSCPYCHLAGGLNPELNQESGGQFTLVSQGGSYVPPVEEMRKLVDSGEASFVWLYSPGHGNGEMGTKAMYCAWDQNKFWEAHDKLMTNAGYKLMNDTVKNDVSKTSELVSFIGNVVDSQKLTACLESGKYDKRIASDTSLSSSLGVQGTPGFFINTNLIGGADNWTNMKSFLN